MREEEIEECYAQQVRLGKRQLPFRASVAVVKRITKYGTKIIVII